MRPRTASAAHWAGTDQRFSRDISARRGLSEMSEALGQGGADEFDDLLRALGSQSPERCRLVIVHAVGGRVDQFADQGGPQRVQRGRHSGAQEGHRLAGSQVVAQRR